MRKPRTRKDLQNDPRLKSIERTSAPEAPWVATTKYPYLFHGNSRTVLGTIKEVCEDMEDLRECPDSWYE